MKAVAEIAGIEVLEDDSRGEGDRDRECAEQARKHRRASGERVGNRHEADQAPGL